VIEETFCNEQIIILSSNIKENSVLVLFLLFLHLIQTIELLSLFADLIGTCEHHLYGILASEVLLASFYLAPPMPECHMP
jgi:hypothetical protein